MSKKRYYFFSDVHLGVKPSIEEKEREKKLVGFLESIRGDAGKLFIVGDLFDCWIEYRKVVPKGYFRTLAKLSEISDQGTEIHFFSGNHDFWLNTYLRDEVGMIMHYSELATEIGGKRFYIVHGDGLSKGDLGYKIIKKILRSRINQFLYSLIHPDLGLWLAQKSSTTSRYYNDDFSRGSMGMKNFAEEKIKEGFDYVIMGHYHRPQDILIENAVHSGHYITLGDWMKHYTYGVYSPPPSSPQKEGGVSEGKFELCKYS